MTGRYTGSFETQLDADLRQIAQAGSGEKFIATLDSIIDQTMTNDYWQIHFPASLESASAYSPTLFAYHASLVLVGAKPLFSTIPISELLDPSTHAPRSALERHHLFPKAYLESLGYDRRMRDQIANLTFVEWPDNAAIGARPPAEYFPHFLASSVQQNRRPLVSGTRYPKDGKTSITRSSCERAGY